MIADNYKPQPKEPRLTTFNKRWAGRNWWNPPPNLNCFGEALVGDN
jgi:hypothetical protein